MSTTSDPSLERAISEVRKGAHAAYAEASDNIQSGPKLSEADRLDIENRFKKNEKLLSEIADKGAAVPQESAGAFKAILQWLMRLLSRFKTALTGDNGRNAYSKAHDELEGAKTPAEMADIARKTSVASKEDSDAAGRMTNQEMQSRVGALLQARAGLGGAEAAVYSQLASGQFKPAPEQEDILAAALESQSQAIADLKLESETLLEQIRRALMVRGNVTIDVEKLQLAQLTELVKQSNMPDILKLCEHAKREHGEITLLKDAASKTYRAAWESMMPLDKVRGAANRIWSVDEQESLLKRFARDDPATAKQRELLERSRIVSNNSGHAAKTSPVSDTMSPASAGDAEALRRKAEDAAKAAAARKAAQANLTETEDQAKKRAEDQAASAQEHKRVQALAAAGRGRVLGQDGKPLTEGDKAIAQKAAQEAIAKAQGISTAAAVVAPVVSVINPAAGAAIATVGTAVGVAGATAKAGMGLAALRARVQANLRPDEIGMEMPEDPYAQAKETVRELANKAGQVDVPSPDSSDGASDDGIGDLPVSPKPIV